VPFFFGSRGDVFGLKLAMMFLLVTLGYIMSISVWAKPLVNNKVVSVKELLKGIKN
jgi:hypothetical protein